MHCPCGAAFIIALIIDVVKVRVEKATENIDMEETEYICSVGLRVLIGTQKKLRDKTCKFIIRNVKPDIMEIFKVTGFTGILTIE